MPHTLYTSFSIDDVDWVAFADRFGWAFRQASAARDAFVGDFHCHSRFSCLVNRFISALPHRLVRRAQLCIGYYNRLSCVK